VVTCVCLDCESGVEEENPLLAPSLQVTMGRPLESGDVRQELLVHVSKRGGRGYPLLHREGEPVCLTGVVVRILPEDDDLDLVERTEPSPAVYLLLRRIEPGLLLQPCLQLQKETHISLKVWKWGNGEMGKWGGGKPW